MAESLGWLTVEDTAQHLNVSKETIYRLLDRKKIPAHKVGKLWRFKLAEIENWVINGSSTDYSDNSYKFKTVLAEKLKNAIDLNEPDGFSSLSLLEIVQYAIDNKIVVDSDHESDLFIESGLLLNSYFCSSLQQIEQGYVPTPFNLAKEMVKLALVDRYFNDLAADKRVSILKNTLAGDSTHLAEIFRNNSEIKILDTGTGFGIFLLAILSVLGEVGCNREHLYKNINIYGIEKNVTFCAVARIRIAVYLSQIFKIDPEESFKLASNMIICGDFLAKQQRTSFLNAQDESLDVYDIVIGNPPYVRQEKFSLELKTTLGINYPGLGGKQDLYGYFMARGLDFLKKSGLLCFITPTSYQKNSSSHALRKLLLNSNSVMSILDFNEAPVFKDIGVQASIVSILKAPTVNNKYILGSDLKNTSTSISDLLSNHQEIDSICLSPNGWRRENLSFVESDHFISLEKYAGEIYSGIKTGCLEAYLIDSDANKYLPDSATTFLKKVLVPKDLGRFSSKKPSHHLLYLPKDYTIEDSMIIDYLQRFETKLRARSDTKDHKTWYGLRECTYIEKFKLPKIVWPEISSSTRFSIDLSGSLLLDGCFFIPKEDYYLLAILNSSTAKMFFNEICNSIGNPKSLGRLRFKKTYIKQFKLPDPSILDKTVFDEICKKSKSLSVTFDQGIYDKLDILISTIFKDQNLKFKSENKLEVSL